MTDYNDGQWHGWNGGECPVEPDTVVQYVPWDVFQYAKADDLVWQDRSGGGGFIAFRVVKPAPRRIWLIDDGDGCLAAAKSLEEAEKEKQRWEEIKPEYPVTITKFVEASND